MTMARDHAHQPTWACACVRLASWPFAIVYVVGAGAGVGVGVAPLAFATPDALWGGVGAVTIAAELY